MCSTNSYKKLYIIILVGFLFYVSLHLSQNQEMAYLQQLTGNKVCTLTTLVENFIKNETWFPVDDENVVFVFSAYYVAQRKRIYVIGARLRHITEATCLLTYVSSNTTAVNITVETKAEINMEQEGKPNKYTSTVLECRVNTNDVPAFVSIVTTPCQPRRILLPVKDVTPVDQYQYTFTVCLSPLFGFTSSFRLVEWIELNKILGANKFRIYVFSTSPDVNQVLKYYSSLGQADVISWRPEVNGEAFQINYRAQTSSLIDCLYRSKRDSEFVVNLDLDEFIIPHAKNINNWTSMIRLIEKSRKPFWSEAVSLISKPYNAYVFRSAFFTTNFYYKRIRDEASDKALLERLRFVTLSILDREQRIFPISTRTKYITRTADLDFMFIHKPETSYAKVQTDIGLLHHYRSTIHEDEKDKFGGRVIDLTIKEKFGLELRKRIDMVWKEILNTEIVYGDCFTFS